MLLDSNLISQQRHYNKPQINNKLISNNYTPKIWSRIPELQVSYSGSWFSSSSSPKYCDYTFK